MIKHAVQGWRDFLDGRPTAALDQLLADDVIFYSPIVYAPQHGKEITAQYLWAARAVLRGATGEGRFRYLNELLGPDVAVLEFETMMRGTYVNGVDLLDCNPDGQISEFRVFIRPLQAVKTVHQEIAALLQDDRVRS